MLDRVVAQEGRSPVGESQFSDSRGLAAPGAPLAATPSVTEVPRGVQLDELVDAVVERIERKVVDELERRGQRRGWGAF
jgi:hypothetical protein